MSILLSAIYLLIFLFLIYNIPFFNINEISRRTLVLLFILKVACGFILTLIYNFYYTSDSYSDAYAFYCDGARIFTSLHSNPVDYLRLVTGIGSEATHLEQFYNTSEYWNKAFNYNLINDNRILIRINAVICLFSFGYYHVHTIFMTFISFIGLTAIFKTFIPFLKNKKKELIFCVFLIPSVLVWTSGVLKESLVVFAFGLFIYAFFKLLYQKISLSVILILVLMTCILLLSKFYFLLAILPGLILLIYYKRTTKRILLFCISIHLLFLLILLAGKFILPEYYFLDIIAQKQHDFINMVQTTGNTGSFISIPIIHPTILSLFKNAVPAFLNTLFRPHFFDIRSIIMIPSVIENSFIFLILIFTFIYAGWKNIENKAIVFALLSFVSILFILFGLITPVIGSLIRYRTPVLPFLFTAMLMIYDKERFQKSTLYKFFKAISRK